MLATSIASSTACAMPQRALKPIFITFLCTFVIVTIVHLRLRNFGSHVIQRGSKTVEPPQNTTARGSPAPHTCPVPVTCPPIPPTIATTTCPAEKTCERCKIPRTPQSCELDVRRIGDKIDHQTLGDVAGTGLAVAIITSNTDVGRQRLGRCFKSMFATPRDTTNIYVISDLAPANARTRPPIDGDAHIHHHDSMCPSDHGSGLCCKTAFAYETMLRDEPPTTQWFFRGMDDTLVLLKNMHVFVAGLDNSREQFIGFRQTYMIHGDNGERHEYVARPSEEFKEQFTEYIYAQGGAGWLINRKLLERLVPVLQSQFMRRCHVSSGQVVADDVQLSMTIIKHLHVPLTHSHAFFRQRVVVRDGANSNCTAARACTANFEEYRYKPIAIHMVVGVSRLHVLARDQTDQMGIVAERLLSNVPYTTVLKNRKSQHGDDRYWLLCACP